MFTLIPTRQMLNSIIIQNSVIHAFIWSSVIVKFFPAFCMILDGRIKNIFKTVRNFHDSAICCCITDFIVRACLNFASFQWANASIFMEAVMTSFYRKNLDSKFSPIASVIATTIFDWCVYPASKRKDRILLKSFWKKYREYCKYCDYFGLKTQQFR